MKRFTVVISDWGKHGRGYRGTGAFWFLASHFGAYAELGLYWFLSEYFGRSQVALVRPSQLLGRSKPIRTEWCFVGLPTSFHADHRVKIQCDRFVLYDSADYEDVHFFDSDKDYLLTQTDVCLKTWRDDRVSYDCRIGLLPIKRPPLNNKLSVAAKKAARLRASDQTPEKSYDVGFVARPTGSVETNPRLRWLVELTQDRPDLKLWGGLVGDASWREKTGASIDPAVLDACWLGEKKIGFFDYFDGLMRSKVALAPSGFAPWSYRHFEALYAGCIAVCNNLSHIEFLIPYPREGMVEVADDASVVPAIEEALKRRTDSPDIIEDNLNELNRWLDAGMYSKHRPELLERFFQQIEAA